MRRTNSLLEVTNTVSFAYTQLNDTHSGRKTTSSVSHVKAVVVGQATAGQSGRTVWPNTPQQEPGVRREAYVGNNKVDSELDYRRYE
jgi:hypothetical protein